MVFYNRLQYGNSIDSNSTVQDQCNASFQQNVWYGNSTGGEWRLLLWFIRWSRWTASLKVCLFSLLLVLVSWSTQFFRGFSLTSIF
uniref:Uncharacterized protein n=1 Tax=Rhizophora mucronata TaxID=61149 RepID=A0A2P2R363_RHIMU